MSKHGGGDDLEDDFIPDDLVALSEGEDDGNYLDIADEIFSFAEDREVKVYDRHGEDVLNLDKKRKRREKAKEKKVKKKIKLAETSTSSTEVGHERFKATGSPFVLANYLVSMQAKTFNALSKIELEDLRIPDVAIVDTSAWTRPRTLDTLIDFISEVLPSLRARLSQKSKAVGAPTLLFVTGAALRAADVTRVFKDRKVRGEKGGEVAKLFAKHFKLEEHVAYLRKARVGVTVGTPSRIGKLLCTTDAFNLSALTHIMLDVSFQDVKCRSLLDVPETRDEVFRSVLGCPKIIDMLEARQVQVVLF